MLIPRVEQLITEIAEKLVWNWNQTKNRFWISREIKSWSAVFFRRTRVYNVWCCVLEVLSCDALHLLPNVLDAGSSATFEVLEGGDASATLTERSCLPMYGTHSPTHIHTHTRTQRLSSPTLLYKRFHDRVAGAIVCCYKKNLTGAVLFSWRFPFRTDGWNGFSMR